jgi:hypothetical protein
MASFANLHLGTYWVNGLCRKIWVLCLAPPGNWAASQGDPGAVRIQWGCLARAAAWSEVSTRSTGKRLYQETRS